MLVVELSSPGYAVRGISSIQPEPDRHFWRYALVFILLFSACALALDLRMKMWNDEVVRRYVAQQGSPAKIVAATKDGMDATPP